VESTEGLSCDLLGFSRKAQGLPDRLPGHHVMQTLYARLESWSIVRLPLSGR
jgi:hypothetical protein